MPTYFPENNEALPTDSVERSMAKVVSQLPAALDKLSLDPHVAVFIERTGATDVANLDAFVKGVKAVGLWDSMVCWPLRRSQNSGTNTAFSLGGLGTFNGTLVNSPTWGTDGVTMLGANSQSIDIADNALLRRSNSVGLMLVFSSANTANFTDFPCLFGKSVGGAINNHNYQFNEVASSRLVGFGFGDNIAGGQVIAANIGANTNKHCLIGSVLIGGSNKLKLNSNATSSSLNTLTQLNSASTAPLRFNRSGLFARGGEYSFGGMFATDLSDGNIDALYTLYKQTLGTGLGLP
jgi:hypothetical protein